MDAFVFTQFMSKPAEKFETMIAPGTDKIVVVEKKSKFSLMTMIQFVLSIAISMYAAYLSWSCSAGEHTFIRILSALFAWFFGVLYILYYMLFKSSSCKFY